MQRVHDRNFIADFGSALVNAWHGSGEHPFYYDTAWDVMRVIRFAETPAATRKACRVKDANSLAGKSFSRICTQSTPAAAISSIFCVKASTDSAGFATRRL